MLSKLLKYELRASGRILLPVYALLLASAMPLASQAALPEERIEPSINAELKQHTQHFVQKLYKVADNVYVLDLKMKRFHTGGSGEAMMVIKRRAEQLRRENGFASYRVVDYVEGIESSTPIAQRYAQGLVQMARSNP